MVAVLPGATALRAGQPVTKLLEKNISELASIGDIRSESRAGFSILTLGQRPARPARVEHEWDKLRDKIASTALTLFILPVLYYLFAAKLRWIC